MKLLLMLLATLLPFQVEGFSWMRHQEVMEEEIRGGILADEMGELGLARCIISSFRCSILQRANFIINVFYLLCIVP